MVHIKFTPHPRTPVVLPKFSLVASETAANASAGHRDSLAEQPDTTLVDDQAVTLTKVTSDQDARSDGKNPSRDTGDKGNASDNGGHVKIGAEDALSGISYDFG
jgi:hypothetical protein